MSFRTRLTIFFLLIVMVPMTAVGILVVRLIDDSRSGKAQARANGLASAAASVYGEASRTASYDARSVARLLDTAGGRTLRMRVTALDTQVGIARVKVTERGRVLADVGDRSAVAPGLAVLAGHGRRPDRTIQISELTAAQYAAQVRGRGFGLVVRQGSQTLAATLAAARTRSLPAAGAITVGGATYQVLTLGLPGFGTDRVRVSVLSNGALTGSAVGTDRLVAGLLIAGFVVLAFGFAFIASRALQGQVSGFLQAARRLGGGDFSSPVPTHGNDEFAALGAEFNNMSAQMQARLTELEGEQARVRRSIRNIGDTFAFNLDRTGLLELALKTAMDATTSDRGRLSAREEIDQPLIEVTHFGKLDGYEVTVRDSERAALEHDEIGQAHGEELNAASVALGAMRPGGPAHGVITVLRPGGPYSEDDLALLRFLAVRASLALDNVQEHIDAQHQAITDDLTGLTTHGHFQELLSAEMEEVRRYTYPVGLVMLDIDNFKSVNDGYGHQQGDRVLRRVSSILRETKRDVDVAARYGGEELCLILPHTDLDGTYAIAERVRAAIEASEIPLVGSEGVLRVTASFGVAATTKGDKNSLIAAADAALYAAKREGKNRTIRAGARTADILAVRVPATEPEA